MLLLLRWLVLCAFLVAKAACSFLLETTAQRSVSLLLPAERLLKAVGQGARGQGSHVPSILT